MADTELSRINPPKQSRSRRTLERILGATLEILETEGPDALTVQAIVDRAGSSVGSFYARFSGKDDLLEYLGERVWREAASRWDAALAEKDWAGLDLKEIVGGAVALLDQAGRSRASYLKALARTPGARDDAYLAFHTHVLRGIEALLLERVAEIDHPEPTVAVPLALQAALAVLEAPVASGLGGAAARERRAQEAQALVLSYLTGRSPRVAQPFEQVDFFDVWG
jgi:AcrR family transcriptional regulator